MIMHAVVAGDERTGVLRVSLHMLPHSTTGNRALVVTAWMGVSFHQLLPIFPPSVMVATISAIKYISELMY